MADILDAINEIIEITLRETNYLAGVIFEKDYVDLTLTLRLHRALLCGQENGAAYDNDHNVVVRSRGIDHSSVLFYL